MLRRLLLILILFTAHSVYAAESKPLPKPKQPAVIKKDSSLVNVRRLDEKVLSSYKRLKEFQYHDEEQQVSLWTRFWRWFWNWFLGLFSFLDVSASHKGFFYIFLKLLQFLVVLLAVGAIVFFVFKVSGIDLLGIFKRKPTAASIPFTEAMENIHEIDFDAEIQKAVDHQNYRLAVRLLYLKSLKQLSESRLINWQPDKTNSTYVAEIEDPDKRRAFQLLTRQFEYVWYGDFAIGAPAFQSIQLMFQDFKNAKA
ncbi:MAG TPA: DUF4129 domain-containing protein [Mucilaginibacter sp.]|nr:DUF4129 domain-containing protein [Mucilaginibacter sp.]